MVGGEAMSKRETVTAPDHDAIARRRNRSLPDTRFDAGVNDVGSAYRVGVEAGFK